MRQLSKIFIARTIFAVGICVGICSGQPTHLARHAGLLVDSSKVALFNKIDETLRDTTAAVAAATAEIATKVDRQTAISAMTQSHVQQLSRIVGQLLTGNSSDLSTTEARSTGGLRQAIEALTETSDRTSARIEELRDIFNTSLIRAEAEARSHESHMIYNLTVALREAREMTNKATRSTQTDELLSQYNNSLAILQSLPQHLHFVIAATYNNASASSMNHAVRSFREFGIVLNQSQSSMRELSVNYTRSVDQIVSLARSSISTGYQYREQMSNISLQNEGLLEKVERIFPRLDEISIAMEGIQQYDSSATNGSQEDRLESVCYPYVQAQRTAKIRSTNITQQWTKKIAEMRHFSEYLSPATSQIMQGPVSYAGCQGAFRNGKRESGVYDIDFNGTTPFRAWCDFDSRGGWMVMQRRVDGTVDFFKGWTDYANGFGNLWGEHWLGLDKVHQLTRKALTLSIYLEAFDGETVWANYSGFRVSNVSQNYSLTLSGYNGTAGDSLSYHNNRSFSTWDRDNDDTSHNCAAIFLGAWWHGNCHASNLNGRYERGHTDSVGTAITWYLFKGNKYGLKVTVMRMLV